MSPRNTRSTRKSSHSLPCIPCVPWASSDLVTCDATLRFKSLLHARALPAKCPRYGSWQWVDPRPRLPRHRGAGAGISAWARRGRVADGAARAAPFDSRFAERAKWSTRGARRAAPGNGAVHDGPRSVYGGTGRGRARLAAQTEVRPRSTAGDDLPAGTFAGNAHLNRRGAERGGTEINRGRTRPRVAGRGERLGRPRDRATGVRRAGATGGEVQ